MFPHQTSKSLSSRVAKSMGSEARPGGGLGGWDPHSTIYQLGNLKQVT